MPLEDGGDAGPDDGIFSSARTTRGLSLNSSALVRRRRIFRELPIVKEIFLLAFVAAVFDAGVAGAYRYIN